MDYLLINAVVAAVSALIGFVTAKVVRSFRLKKDCVQLAEAAKTALKESGRDIGYQAWQLTSVDRELKARDKEMLGAYARLLGNHSALRISFAAIMTKKIKLDNPSTTLSVETLTAQQVTAFHAIRDEFDIEDEHWNYLDSSASMAGAYAMEHLDDYPLMLLIVKRGIKDLDEIKTVLAEMKETKTVSLSDGML